MTAGLTLGAPGVLPSPDPAPGRGLPPIRLDATGFVGICWRGPPNEPVAVSSWSQFVELFGGVGDADAGPCPGYLPRSVRAFFDQGGRTAWVCRVVPAAPDGDAVARFCLPGLDTPSEATVEVLAADEGSWGDRLEVTLSYATGPALPAPAAGSGTPGGAPARSVEAADDDPDRLLVLADMPALPSGSVLLTAPSAEEPAGMLHRVVDQELRPLAGGGRARVLTIDPPLPAGRRGADGTVDARVVTADLEVLDRDPVRRRTERITGLGLLPEHPRFPARQLPPDHPAHPGTVLSAESRLIRTGGGWAAGIAPHDPSLPPVTSRLAHGGVDRFAAIDEGSLFDDGPPDGDPLDEEDDHVGVDLIGRVEELGLLCVPDLTWSGATGHLDPRDGAALARIVARQRRLVAVAELRRRFSVLLDAPSRLSPAGLARWRSNFDSSYAAAYHPWLAVPGEDRARRAVPVPPSAVAAGVVAARERRLGLPWGPANELAANVVTAADQVPDAVHDELHRLGINVFRAERDGFRLTSARTLGLDPHYRQLSVRRLMTMIALTVERQAQWLVFEPNTADLRAALFQTLSQFLRGLFRAGAFAGDTEPASFFVRCDDRLNPAASLAAGRLVAEIGVAPSSPLEYLVLRITQDADTGATVTPVSAGAGMSSTRAGGVP